VPLTLSQVSKINGQSIQNFIKNDGFEYRVNCRYTKTFFQPCASCRKFAVRVSFTFFFTHTHDALTHWNHGVDCMSSVVIVFVVVMVVQKLGCGSV